MKKEVKGEQSSVGKFFSTTFLVLSIIIGLISFLTAIASFLSGFTVSGILYLILGIFTFLPKKIIKMPNWTKFLIAFIVFIVLLIIGAMYWRIPDDLISHNLQETFILDGGASNISMIIYNTTKTTSILVNNQEKTTEGYFLFVNCELTNLGKSAVTINPAYNLADNQNKTYAGLGFSGSQEYFQPDLKKQSYFLFEIPESAQGIRFHIRDKTGIHVVDLGI